MAADFTFTMEGNVLSSLAGKGVCLLCAGALSAHLEAMIDPAAALDGNTNGRCGTRAPRSTADAGHAPCGPRAWAKQAIGRASSSFSASTASRASFASASHLGEPMARRSRPLAVHIKD